MTISGTVDAKCNECYCRVVWHMDNQPFLDSSINGTCDECINEKTHDCYDELVLTENNAFLKSGKKQFNKKLKVSE